MTRNICFLPLTPTEYSLAEPHGNQLLEKPPYEGKCTIGLFVSPIDMTPESGTATADRRKWTSVTNREAWDGAAAEKWSLHLGDLADQIVGGAELLRMVKLVPQPHESSSWVRMPSSFDQVRWQLAHTAADQRDSQVLEELGYTVSTENQNSFSLRGGMPSLGASRT